MSKKRQQQTEIPGTETPKNPEVEQALDAWLNAKDEQKDAAATTKLRHHSLLLRLAEAKIERYPYIDPSSGKKKMVVVAREPKAKTITAPKESQARRDRGDVDEPGEEVTTPAETVEHRKVSRESVENEIDPFGGVRARMESP